MEPPQDGGRPAAGVAFHSSSQGEIATTRPLTVVQGLLHETNSANATYLFQQDKFYDVSYDTGDKSVQCGRKVDAFKLWFMLKVVYRLGFCTNNSFHVQARGEDYMEEIVDNAFAMTDYLEELVSIENHQSPLFSVRWPPPQASVWCPTTLADSAPTWASGTSQRGCGASQRMRPGGRRWLPWLQRSRRR